MEKPPHVVLNNNNPDSILWEELDDIKFKYLKESFMNPPDFGHPNYQISFLYIKRKGMTLKYLPQNTGTTIKP